MSDNPLNRLVSHSKTVDLDQQQNTLDRTEKLKDAYDQALAGKQKAADISPLQPETNTSQRQHAPEKEPHLKPVGEIRRLVDQQIDAENRQKEIDRAKALNEAAKLRAREHSLQDREHEKDNRDRSR